MTPEEQEYVTNVLWAWVLYLEGGIKPTTYSTDFAVSMYKGRAWA